MKKIAIRIKAANYSVFIWAPGELQTPHAELVIQTTCEMVKELNKTIRSAGLSIGGSNGGATFNNVCTWQSGYPSRISYNKGYPEYLPYKFSTQEALQRTEADALLWISSFDQSSKPPQTSIPTIALSRPVRKIALDVEVYIPVGTPGLDHTGNLFRTDVVVNMPLKQIRQSQILSVSDVLTKIQHALKNLC